MKTRNQYKRYLSLAFLAIACLIWALRPAKFLPTPRDSRQADKLSPAIHSENALAVRQQDLKAMRARVMAARPLALYYSMGDTFGLDSIVEHASEMTVLAPQCYWLDQDGNIQGSIPLPVMEAARRAQLPVMPLLYNRDFSRSDATALLNNRGLQRQVIKSMADIAGRENLLGFQLDFENIDPHDENLYSRFVRDTAEKLHREGRLLSVAVIPRFQDSRPNEWSAAYDYPALAQAADFLTLMAYDNSGRNGPPGPIAGYDWVRQALAYALRRVPPQKLLLGIALYGREWTTSGRAIQARTLPYPETKALLDQLSLTPRWDVKQRSPWFEYRTGSTTRSVWYENARSIQEKLTLLGQFRLRGFAAWRLGMEDPRLWSLVSAMRQSRPSVLVNHSAGGY
jgi:spore germination protein YaaH